MGRSSRGECGSGGSCSYSPTSPSQNNPKKATAREAFPFGLVIEQPSYSAANPRLFSQAECQLTRASTKPLWARSKRPTAASNQQQRHQRSSWATQQHWSQRQRGTRSCGTTARHAGTPHDGRSCQAVRGRGPEALADRRAEDRHRYRQHLADGSSVRVRNWRPGPRVGTCYSGVITARKGVISSPS